MDSILQTPGSEKRLSRSIREASETDMPSIEEHISHHLGLIDQATQEGRACRVAMGRDGRPVVETSPKEFLKQGSWKLLHRRNAEAERTLREMIIDVIRKPETSLSLRKQVFEGAKAGRYVFFSEREAKVIEENEALMLRPDQKKEPVTSKPLPKRKVKLQDAMNFKGRIREVSGNPKRHQFPDAMKSSGPAREVKKRTPPEIPAIPFTPPTITVTPPAEEAQQPGESTPIDFEATPVLQQPSETTDSPPINGGIPYIPTPVEVPEDPPEAPVSPISRPITLVPMDSLERPVIFPKVPRLMLEEARKELETKLPAINLADADQFLWLYYTCVFLEEHTSDDSDELKAQLEQSFAAAGLSNQYRKRQTEQMWQAVRMLKADLSPEAFTECTDEISQISSPMRFSLTQHLVRDINQLGFRKLPYPNGDPAKKIDAFQLEFLEQVKDTDELMEELGFEIEDPDESDHPLEARAKLVDVRAQLENELLTYSTEHESFAQLVDQLEEVDPAEIRKKIEDGITLTGEELQAIIAAKKQKLEIAQRLGKKWGDSLLLDGRNWPDSYSRQTLSKLYDLASLDSPAINATLTGWILDKHQQAEYHPQVIIDGSGIHGLLAALTQVEAGANVTLLLNPEPVFAANETVRLDPQWMEALRFHLGAQFDLLFTSLPDPEHHSPQNTDSSSGLLHPDGFGEISAGTLHQALWNQVLEMAGPDASPLKMVANARVVDIEAPDQQNTKHLVHLEHQSEQGSHRNKVPVDLLINARAEPDAPSAEYLATKTVDDKAHKAETDGQARPPKRLACRCAFSLPPASALNEPALRSPFYTTVTDSSFSQSLAKNMQERLGHMAPVLPGIRENMLNRIQLNLIERKEDFDNNSQYTITGELEKLCLSLKNEPVPLKIFHTENRHVIQIDMELPAQLCQFLEIADAYLQHHDATTQEAAAIRQQIMAAWFETVVVHTELPERGIQPEHLRLDSLSTFAPKKTALDPAVETLEADNSMLTITAIGPAAVKNPMSPEANQTSAREHIFQCQALTEKLSEHYSPEGHLKDAENLLEDAEDMAQKYLLLQKFVFEDD
ncbi:hypothetical protein [Endozoicomonas sp. ALD040]|uniref:hypothetical protein n=1 Tax=Endozoicomonas sp. ALD040 TaxID=3403079 RepID=UPI003BB057E0